MTPRDRCPEGPRDDTGPTAMATASVNLIARRRRIACLKCKRACMLNVPNLALRQKRLGAGDLRSRVAFAGHFHKFGVMKLCLA
jgi:hypothetical protein